MARLALDWVEKNFKLSRHVTMMEKDFSNGYLFAEMLLQRGLIDDDVEFVVDSDMPLDVMKNFNVVGKALRKLDISLTKKLVADIMSEQPGGAAELIMNIKRSLEADSSRPVKSATITSVKSLRPRQFVRKSETLQQMSPEDRFLSTTLPSSHAFCDIDMMAQIDKFFTLDIIETDKYKQNESMAAHQREEMVARRRQKMLADIEAKKKLRQEIAAAGAKSHRAVQNVKKNRIIRDLQYEVALETKAELINQMRNNSARDEALAGIDNFEFNLKRSGLGGDDYSEQELVPTSESTLLFMDRVERDVSKHWPTNGEISDFMMNLEKRTSDLRAARQEKARRKRRMQVDQASSSSSLEVVDEHDDEEEPMELEVDKATLKQQKIDAINERVAVEREKLAKLAEEKVAQFCDEVRQRVSDEDRARLVEQVLAAREQKMAQKSKQNAKLCREVLGEIVDEAIGVQVVVKAVEEVTEKSRDDIITALMDKICSRADGDEVNAVSSMGAAERILQQCSSTSDIWPSVANSVLQFGSIFGNANKTFLDMSLDIAQSLLEYLGKDSLEAFPMQITAAESGALHSLTADAYYIVMGQQGISRTQWEKFCGWFNTSRVLVGLWDCYDALQIATSMKNAFDENNASINDYAFLCKLFGIGEGLSGEITGIPLRVVNDIIEYTTIISTSEITETPSFSFTDTTLSILVAQTLWLRSHIAKSYTASTGASHPFPRTVIISKCFGCADATVGQLGLMEWCLRGGWRLNVADDDTLLQGLLTEEQATQKPAAANKKASVKSTKPKKGKLDLDGVEDASGVKYVVNFAGGTSSPILWDSENAVVNIVSQYLNRPSDESFADTIDTISILCSKSGCDLLNLNLSSEGRDGYRNTPNAFIAMESVAACVLQAAKTLPSSSPAEANESTTPEAPEAANASVVQSLQDIISSRRASFNISQQLLINHWNADHVLPLSDLVEAFNSLQFSKCCEVELLGSIVAAILVKIKEFDAEISLDEALVVDVMKINDPRWKEFCFRYLDTLGKIESKLIVLDHERAKEQLQDYSNDLLCSIGDVIDERHRHWINKILSLHDKYKAMITAITDFILTMAVHLGKTLRSLTHVQATALKSLGSVLQSAGYAEYPWSSTSASEDVCSSMGVLQQLADIAGGGSGALMDAWKDNISSVEGDMNDHNRYIHDATICATSYIQFFCSTIVSLQQRNKESGEGMILKALKRNTYEHGLLKNWFHELKATFHDSYYNELISASSPRRSAGTKKSTQSAPIKFLSTYYFGVSEDADADGVEISSMAHGVVEVKDMSLAMSKVRKLCAALLAGDKGNNAEMLSSAVKRLLDDGETLPLPWRQAKKLQSFAEQFSTLESISFIQRLVVTLVLSNVTSAPSSFYITRLCRAVLLRHSKIPHLQASPTYVKYADVLAAADADEVLKKGWWPATKKQKKKRVVDDMLIPALEALAMTCVDADTPFVPATAMVNLDRLAALLCSGPDFLFSTKIYNEYNGQDVADRIALNSELLKDTQCKVLSVAAELVTGGAKAQTMGIAALGPEITSAQVEWAANYMPDVLPTPRNWIGVTIDDNNNVTINSKSSFVCGLLVSAAVDEVAEPAIVVEEKAEEMNEEPVEAVSEVKEESVVDNKVSCETV